MSLFNLEKLGLNPIVPCKDSISYRDLSNRARFFASEVARNGQVVEELDGQDIILQSKPTGHDGCPHPLRTWNYTRNENDGKTVFVNAIFTINSSFSDYPISATIYTMIRSISDAKSVIDMGFEFYIGGRTFYLLEVCGDMILETLESCSDEHKNPIRDKLLRADRALLLDAKIDTIRSIAYEYAKNSVLSLTNAKTCNELTWRTITMSDNKATAIA